MKILFPYVFLFFCVSTGAQQFSIKWSKKFAITSGIFSNNVYIQSLPTGNGTTISLFKKIKSFGMANDYILVKFNTQPDVEKQAELNFPDGGREGLIEMVKLQNNFYLVKYRISSKESADIVISKLNPETLTTEGPEKRIGTIDDLGSASSSIEKMILDPALYTSYSSDSSKFVIAFEPDQKRKENKKMQVMVFNNNLLKVYSKFYEWNNPSNKVYIPNISIDNTGRVLVLYNIYEKDFEKELLRSDGEKIPSYTSHLLVVDENGVASSDINSNGKFIHNASIAYNEKKQPLLIGIYKEKNNSRLTGVFRAAVNPGQSNKTVSDINFTPYPQDLLDKADKDNQGKSSGKNPGLDNNFHTNYVVCVSDGINHMISEYFDIDSKGANNEFTKFIKGDFIITTFQANGKPEFQRLPRYQQTMNSVSSTNISQAGSYTPDYFNDKLVLFYNDGTENINKDLNEGPEKFSGEKKSALTVAILSHEGKLQKRKLVYDHSGMDGYVTNLRFTEIKENQYLIFAFKAGNFKHGMMVGTLLIK